MKHRRIDWSKVPWTMFEATEIPESNKYSGNVPSGMMMNSRYQVTIYVDDVPPFGRVAHLSIKTHDRQAHHDWRDLQRVKNEICGPEYDAVEVYPAESKLVDTSNQYHLYVFHDYRLPFGFQTRLVSDGSWNGSKQRPFVERPPDCMTPEEIGVVVERVRGKSEKT